MVHMDHGLISTAQSLINGANVHRVGNMILAYEVAVRLHNNGTHLVYKAECEKQLRQFIADEGQKRAACAVHGWRDSKHLVERTEARWHAPAN